MSAPVGTGRPRRVARGVGLVEVMVTVLVLGLGFLAAGRLQVQSLRDAQTAYHRSQAQLLLGDMMDRMRNNPLGVADGAYDAASTARTSATDCVTRRCTPAELAAHDLHAWRLALDPGAGRVPRLPRAANGDAALGSIAALADGTYEVSLSWKTTAGSTETRESLSTRFVPRSGS